ncbi:transcriptional regulator [Rhizobium sp. Root73]|uniref:ChrR family anti-sigma-E factor n=1 Tax=unclassified Rhizobium TaxID=2613769 RepID=UPI0007130FE3|nr:MULTISPECIES: ChrR family anti-sigma-E factor [unclassified Rhizobium]KQV31272.1 transcriptional regulator [Rhizobium sp. Root1204]KQY10776.1 transcriptional regulator [Rhizobium sp. Root1334]KRC04761.1 transcriptional regulator [Rhizobium sp. Root73]
MADVQLDTVDALMARYAAGVLPEPARVLVEAHLEMQSVNRPRVAEYETVAGDILEHMEPVSFRSRDSALRAIFAAPPLAAAKVAPVQPASAFFPKAIRDFAGLDATEIPWKRKLPGFKEYSLGKIDGCDVSFFWLKPGRVIPAHTHEGYELSLVLDGAFNDTRGRFAKGDISVADESIDHRPVAESECPCIGFAVFQAPLKLTGSWKQLLGDLIG